MKEEVKKTKVAKRNTKSTKKKVTKKSVKKNEIIEKTNQYSEYEEFHTEKQLNKVFKFLMFLSVSFGILIVLKNKDICMDVSYTKCGLAYYIVNNSVFFIFLWIENILAIVFSLYKIFCAILDKSGKNIIIGIICILVQPIVWENVLKALNIL